MTRPVIGSRWEPPTFERRHADGSYSAKNPYLGVYELAVQDAFLTKNRRTTHVALAWRTVAAALLALFAYVARK